MPLTDLRGKTAVITGGASGIGLALARRCQSEGMKVVLIDWEKPALDAAAAAIGAPGYLGDVREAEGMQALAQRIATEQGPVHLLCSNAGVVLGAGVMNLSPQDWRWMFDINVFGAVNAVSAFLPLLQANADGGHILFTASLASLSVARGQGAYAASKHALAAFGETLSMELQAEGGKVGVSLLCPGPVVTNFGDSQRNRTAEYGPPRQGPPDVHTASFVGEIPPEQWFAPEDVARIAIAGVKRGDLWIVTHPSLMGQVEDRARAWAAATKVAATLN